MVNRFHAVNESLNACMARKVICRIIDPTQKNHIELICLFQV